MPGRFDPASDIQAFDLVVVVDVISGATMMRAAQSRHGPAAAAMWSGRIGRHFLFELRALSGLIFEDPSVLTFQTRAMLPTLDSAEPAP